MSLDALHSLCDFFAAAVLATLASRCFRDAWRAFRLWREGAADG